MQETLFAFDCGSTNWRIYRAGYERSGESVRMLGEPQPSPLTSFIDRRLPSVVLLNPDGNGLENYGEVAQQQLEDEKTRERIREYWKPCIGAYLERNPLAHQKRYTHDEALRYTALLLEATLAQLQHEKWRSAPFDDRVRFSFAYPVHWRYENQGKVLDDFRNTVLNCLPEKIHSQTRFVAEPEGAILSLQHQGLLCSAPPGRAGVTLIADIGGSTSDLVAGQVNPLNSELDYLGRYGEPHGGGLYDAEIAKFIAEDMNIPISALADDPSALVTLRVFGRQLKEALSRQLMRPNGGGRPPQYTVTLVTRGGDVFRRTVSLSEETFREKTRHLITDFEKLIDKGLQAMGLSESQVGQVILVGGGGQLFSIIAHLRSRFGREAVVLADNPDELVVQGVALEYGKTFGLHRPELNFEAVRTDKLEPETPPTPPAKQYTSPAAGQPQAQVLTSPVAGPGSKPGEWQLVSREGATFKLLQGINTIGRKQVNTVWLLDDQVSRMHAEIRVEGGQAALVDLGGVNGSWVNGVRLATQQPHPLKEGDEIKIGRVFLMIRKL